MATTYEEFFRKVLLRVDTDDGRALLAAKESVNDAQKDIARVWDVDELIVLDTTSADTVDGTKRYHLEDDLSLTRPKDIFGIKLEDESSSRRLIYKTPKWVDEHIPYPEGTSEGKSTIYTRRGNYIELIPIPDAAYDLHIHHSQWPTALSADDDETDYVDLDDVIISLATDRVIAILEQETGIDWNARARYYLAGAVREDRDRPDEMLIAQPFRSRPRVTSDYWKDPFEKHNP